MKNKFLISVLSLSVIMGAIICGCSTKAINTINPAFNTSESFEKNLNDYATLLAQKALNVGPGQTVIIECQVENSYFADKCIDACYNAGADNVVMNWIDNYSKNQKIARASEDAINNMPNYEFALKNEYTKNGASILSITSDNPKGSADVPADRSKAYSKAKAKATEDYHMAANNNDIAWVVAAVPNKDWAEMVFPKLKGDEAVSALWDAIFTSVRVKGDGKVLEAWAEHTNNLSSKAEKMNEYNFKTLHYTNETGTDLTIDLPENHVWLSGQTQTTANKPFIANIPTEEIYTSPLKNSANGIVYASKPLVIRGTVIEGIRFNLKDGKIVEAHADTGEDVLKAELDTEEAAKYFGEVALVPYDSAISNQSLLYYNTLFDENAACHIAFGFSYPTCIKDGSNMTEDQLVAQGLNQCSIHNDFMVGTNDLNIVGTTHDGKEITIFKDGNWAF